MNRYFALGFSVLIYANSALAQQAQSLNVLPLANLNSLILSNKLASDGDANLEGTIRALRAIPSRSKSPTEFGAACSGSGDDTVAIQRAMDTLAGTGVALKISGTCVAGALHVPSGTILTAAPNGTLRVSKAAPQYFLTLPTSAKNITIRDITFDSVNAPVKSVAIYLPPGGKNVGPLYIANNHFINIPNKNSQNEHAVMLNGANLAVVEANVVDQSSGDALNFNGGFYLVTANRVSHSGDGCIAFNNRAHGLISDNALSYCNLGVGAGPEGNQVDANDDQVIIISNNMFVNCLHGVNMGWFAFPGRRGPLNWKIVGNTFANTEREAIEYDGDKPGAFVNGVIENNKFIGGGAPNYDGKQYSAADVSLNNAGNMSISGNVFSSPKGVANSQMAISLNSSPNFSVADNSIGDSVGGHYKFTIYVNNSATGVVAGNSIKTVGYGVVLDGGGANHVTIAKNKMSGIAGVGILVNNGIFYSTIASNEIDGGTRGAAIQLPQEGREFAVTDNAINWGGDVAITKSGSTWASYSIIRNSARGAIIPPLAASGGSTVGGGK
jgi:hypothetical protein